MHDNRTIFGGFEFFGKAFAHSTPPFHNTPLCARRPAVPGAPAVGGGALVPVAPGGVSVGVTPPMLPNLPPDQQDAARKNAMNGNGGLNPIPSFGVS